MQKILLLRKSIGVSAAISVLAAWWKSSRLSRLSTSRALFSGMPQAPSSPRSHRTTCAHGERSSAHWGVSGTSGHPACPCCPAGGHVGAVTAGVRLDRMDAVLPRSGRDVKSLRWCPGTGPSFRWQWQAAASTFVGVCCIGTAAFQREMSGRFSSPMRLLRAVLITVKCLSPSASPLPLGAEQLIQGTGQIKMLHSSSLPPSVGWGPRASWHRVPFPGQHSHQPESQRPRCGEGTGISQQAASTPRGFPQKRASRLGCQPPSQGAAWWSEKPRPRPMASSPPQAGLRDKEVSLPRCTLQSADARCSNNAVMKIV